MHLKLEFPKDYPLSPPKVNVLNWKLYHSNVMYNSEICMEMLNNSQGNSEFLLNSFNIFLYFYDDGIFDGCSQE